MLMTTRLVVCMDFDGNADVAYASLRRLMRAAENVDDKAFEGWESSSEWFEDGDANACNYPSDPNILQAAIERWIEAEEKRVYNE